MNEHLLKAINDIQEPYTSSSIKSVSSVNGGCIHKAWQVTLNNGKKLFAKTNNLECWQMLVVESKALELLNNFAETSYLDIPKPIALEKHKDQKDLIIFKKALFLIKNGNKSEGNKILNYLISSNSSVKSLAQDIIKN